MILNNAWSTRTNIYFTFIEKYLALKKLLLLWIFLSMNILILTGRSQSRRYLSTICFGRWCCTSNSGIWAGFAYFDSTQYISYSSLCVGIGLLVIVFFLKCFNPHHVTVFSLCERKNFVWQFPKSQSKVFLVAEMKGFFWKILHFWIWKPWKISYSIGFVSFL